MSLNILNFNHVNLNNIQRNCIPQSKKWQLKSSDQDTKHYEGTKPKNYPLPLFRTAQPLSPYYYLTPTPPSPDQIDTSFDFDSNEDDEDDDDELDLFSHETYDRIKSKYFDEEEGYSDEARFIVHGVDIRSLETNTERYRFNFQRIGGKPIFDQIFPQIFESINVMVTNDYEDSEAWAERILKSDIKPRILGTHLFHGFLNRAPPMPTLAELPKKRYRQLNAPPAPERLPPGGPLKLKEGGAVIAMIGFATEKDILLLQLRQMHAIGPSIRSLLENPFLKKSGRDVVRNRKVLREDGLQLVLGEEIESALRRTFAHKQQDLKIKRMLKYAGIEAFIKSIVGLEIPATEYAPYLWGEISIPVEMVEYASKLTYGYWSLRKALSYLDHLNENISKIE